MIQDTYVNFEIAKLLKKSGFNENVRRHYFTNGVMSTLDTAYRNWNESDDFYSAPSHQMTMRWLREEHDLHIVIFIDEDYSTDADGKIVETWNFWSYSVTDLTGHILQDNSAQFSPIEYLSFEEAAEGAIKYSLENLI